MTSLAGIGIADYRAQWKPFSRAFASPPVLLGHSMGAVIAQQLAAQGLARSLILVSPAPRAGILPPTGGEKQLDQDLMGLGAFWKIGDPSGFRARLHLFAEPGAGVGAARRVRQIRPRIGARLLPIVLLDARPDRRDAPSPPIRCAAPCSASQAPTTSWYRCSPRAQLPSLIAARPSGSSQGHGHMLLVEPGADEIAERIAAWIPS